MQYCDATAQAISAQAAGLYPLRLACWATDAALCRQVWPCVVMIWIDGSGMVRTDLSRAARRRDRIRRVAIRHAQCQAIAIKTHLKPPLDDDTLLFPFNVRAEEFKPYVGQAAGLDMEYRRASPFNPCDAEVDADSLVFNITAEDIGDKVACEKKVRFTLEECEKQTWSGNEEKKPIVQQISACEKSSGSSSRIAEQPSISVCDKVTDSGKSGDAQRTDALGVAGDRGVLPAMACESLSYENKLPLGRDNCEEKLKPSVACEESCEKNGAFGSELSACEKEADKGVKSVPIGACEKILAGEASGATKEQQLMHQLRKRVKVYEGVVQRIYATTAQQDEKGKMRMLKQWWNSTKEHMDWLAESGLEGEEAGQFRAFLQANSDGVASVVKELDSG